MKTNIKLRVTPEQSEAVQKICFANGINWSGGENKISYTFFKYLFIEPTGIWCRGITDHNKGSETLGYTEVDADLFIRTNGTCEESVELVNNLLNNKSKEDMFKQYGFEVPNFDCTILAKVEDKYIGYVTTNQGDVYPTYWFANGCRHIDEGNQWNLTPIKKPWYETCKFPMLVWDKDNNAFLLYRVDNFTTDMLNTFRPLSNAEIDRLKQDF